MHVNRIDQIAIAVENLDEALAFYERCFGLRASERRIAEADGIEEAMLDVGGVWLQIIAPTSVDSPVARFLERRGPGLHHVGFAVDSVEQTLEHLRAEQVELIDQTPRPSSDGGTIAFVHPRGTGGVLVELVQELARDDGHTADSLRTPDSNA